MTGGQRRPSFDLSIEDSAFLKHELEAIDPLQLTSSQRRRRQRQKGDSCSSKNDGDDTANDSSDRESSSTTCSDDDGITGSGDFWLETRLFLELAGVSSLMNLSFIMSPLLTASYIGRSFPPVYLSAFTLANLTGNLCTFSLMAGLFSASDTLSPQAFGRKDYPEVGRLAIRGFVVAFCLICPINVILYLYFKDIMIALGQDIEASTHASHWYKVFAFNLPFSILFNCLWKFLTAQHIMKPLILVSILCTGLVLPLSLEICIGAMGFVGSAVGYVFFQVSQSLVLLAYVWWTHPHHPGTWPGLSWESVHSALWNWNQTKEFLRLGLGGIMAQCEWIFWEALGLVIGKLGVVALSVHTIPNQTIMAFCMVPFAFGIAVAIRMGVSLPISVKRTQAIVLVTSLGSIFLFGMVSVVIYILRDAIIGLFTNDDDVKELADVIWLKVAIFNMNIAVFGLLAGVATGLGKQWALGVINFVFLWMFGLPMIYYTAVIKDQGLNAAWFWMNVPYLCMNITLAVLFVCTDWYQIQDQILSSGDSKAMNDEDDNACCDKDRNITTPGVLTNETTALL